MRAGVALALLLVVGCLGGFSVTEVPSDPIAFIHQDPGSVSSLEEFLGAVDLVTPNSGRRQLRATIALLTVPTNEIQEIPDTGAGAFPMDWDPDGIRLLVGRMQARRSFALFAWNRLTGSWNRLTPGESIGSASLGGGPIRAALVGPPPRGVRTGTGGIVVTVDGQERLTLGGTSGGREPNVSPDGRTVIYVQRHPRPGREPMIMLTDLDRQKPRMIGRGNQARFSRDGTMIVFVTRRPGNADVWLMRGDGSAKRPLVTSGFDDQFPSLSPDGRFVVYASARDMGTSQLYLTRISDGVETQLTHTGQNGRPVW